MSRPNLTEGSISKAVIKLAVPLILTNIFSTIFEIVDAIFVGRIGSSALAAVSIAGTILFFLATFGAGLSVGTVALIARYTGAKKYEEANEVAFQSFILGFIIASILGITGYIFSPDILKLLGAKGEVFNQGLSYIRILFLGIFTMFFLFLGSAVLRGTGDTKTPLKIIATATVLNIFLDWVMIFGKLGFPRLGTAGAALATVISRGFGGLFFLFLLIRGEHNIHLNFKKFTISLTVAKKIFLIGFPASIQMFIRSTSALILIRIVTIFGTAVIAGYGVCSRIFSLFLLPGFGFADTAATLVGQNLGALKKERAKKSVLLSALYYLTLLIVLAVISFIFAEQIIRIFNEEPKVVSVGARYLRFMSVGTLFMSFGVVLSRSFQGAGDSITPMIVTVASLYLFQIPLAYILSIKMNMKETGIWISMPLSSMLQAGLMMFLFFKGKWLHKKI